MALVLDFTKADFKRDGDKVFITGQVIAPVDWQYKLTLGKDDIAGILYIMTSFPTLRYALPNLLPGFIKFFKNMFIKPKANKT